MARTTSRTSIAPQSRNSPTKIPMRGRRCAFSRTAAKPASTSASAPTSPSVTAGTGPSTPATSSAETSVTRAISPNTRSAPEMASSTPVRTPATRTPPFSTQLVTTFVAVSSSAERASDGWITACAGRVIVTAVAATTAPA